MGAHNEGFKKLLAKCGEHIDECIDVYQLHARVQLDDEKEIFELTEGKCNIVKDSLFLKEDKRSADDINKVEDCVRINREKLFKDMSCSQRLVKSPVKRRSIRTSGTEYHNQCLGSDFRPRHVQVGEI